MTQSNNKLTSFEYRAYTMAVQTLYAKHYRELALRLAGKEMDHGARQAVAALMKALGTDALSEFEEKNGEDISGGSVLECNVNNTAFVAQLPEVKIWNGTKWEPLTGRCSSKCCAVIVLLRSFLDLPQKMGQSTLKANLIVAAPGRPKRACFVSKAEPPKREP